MSEFVTFMELYCFIVCLAMLLFIVLIRYLMSQTLFSDYYSDLILYDIPLFFKDLCKLISLYENEIL